MKTSVNVVLAAFLAFGPLLASASSVGPCHPYPGAAAPDCLELIGNNLNNQDKITCNAGRATVSLRNCVIVTTCASGVSDVETDTSVRRALTAIGTCALNDYGSISGYYIADDNSKTCYLYPGKCVLFLLGLFIEMELIITQRVTINSEAQCTV